MCVRGGRGREDSAKAVASRYIYGIYNRKAAWNSPGERAQIRMATGLRERRERRNGKHAAIVVSLAGHNAVTCGIYWRHIAICASVRRRRPTSSPRLGTRKIRCGFRVGLLSCPLCATKGQKRRHLLISPA